MSACYFAGQTGTVFIPFLNVTWRNGLSFLNGFTGSTLRDFLIRIKFLCFVFFFLAWYKSGKSIPLPHGLRAKCPDFHFIVWATLGMGRRHVQDWPRR